MAGTLIAREEDAVVLLSLILGGAEAARVADLEELAVDLLHVELLRLTVVHREEVVELGRRLVEVEGQLLLFVILGFEVVGAAAALVRAARAPFGVHRASVAMRGHKIVDLCLHVRVDVQLLAKKVLAEGQTLEELVAGMRRRVAAIVLLRLVRL